ncbi:MAG: response regulator [Candidatus Omnitrophica bacterium]|nr:response regulator [Candidatus Omnitrophota bacterium]
MEEHFSQEEKNSKPLDILLVEDNETDIKITLRAFSKVKIKNNIYVVNDGEEALDFIRHEGKYQDKEKFPRPDLILLDINLPKMDGFQVLEALKKDIRYNYIPIVMLTSSRDQEDIARSYRDGAASFIPKPLNYDDFVKVVEGFNFYWNMINKLPNPDIPKE